MSTSPPSSPAADTWLSAARRSPARKFVLVLVLWWALTAFVYRKTESNFLRAESGWYLFLAQSPAAVQDDFIRKALTNSRSGHYSPVGFVAEFLTAKVIGTKATFWKWRQVTVLSVLAAILYCLVKDSAKLFGLSRNCRMPLAGATTAVLIFQPWMTDFIAWPFMIFQLLWLILTTLALHTLVRLAEGTGPSYRPWLAIGAAYGSLHFLGLGLATVAATAAVLGSLAWQNYRSTGSRKLVMPVATLLALTAFHALLMIALPHAETIPYQDRSAHFLSAAFGFVPGFAIAAVHALFSSYPFMIEGWQLQADWPYGGLFLVILAIAVTATTARFFRALDSTPAARGIFVLTQFGAVCFLMLVILIGAREIQHPSPAGFRDYLVGSRYLIPAGFSLVGLIILTAIQWNRLPLAMSLLINIGLFMSAIIGNAQFGKNVYPKLEPQAIISHANAWRSVVAMASQCRQAHLPIPNVPLGILVREFDWDLKTFEPLLRADLKLPPDTGIEFVPFDTVSGMRSDEYAKQVPALRDVKQTLRLR